MVVSNPLGKERIDFFNKLSQYKLVHSGGSVLNNVGGKVSNKLTFVEEHKFTIAFENSSYPGYTTEKILQPKHVDTVPIYWGNPIVDKEINPDSFINYYDYGSLDALCEKVKQIDGNVQLYKKYLAEPIFPDFQPNKYFEEERIIIFFNQVCLKIKNSEPVSHSFTFKQKKFRYIISRHGSNAFSKTVNKAINLISKNRYYN